MSKKIHIRNLPSSITHQILFDSMNQVGTATHVDVFHNTNTEAIVTMLSEDEAKTAVEQFNGAEYEDHRLVVEQV